MKLTNKERRRRWRRMQAYFAKSEDWARYLRRSNDETLAASMKALSRASVRVKEKP